MKSMTTDAPMVALEQIARIQKGSTITAKSAIKGDVPVIAGGIKPAYFHNESNREANAITVSASGAAGYVSFHPYPIYASDCITVESRDLGVVDQRYLFLALLAMQDHLYSLSRGTALQHVYAKDLKSLMIPLPPLEKQKRIVEVLDDHLSRLDKAFADLREGVEKIPLANMAWMHQYLGELSISGATTTLGSIAETRLGKMLDAAKNVGVPTPYLRNINVQWDKIDISDLDVAPMTEANLKELALQPGDLLVCEGGEPGRCAVWSEPVNNSGVIAFQKALHRVRPNRDYLPEYIALVLKSLAKSNGLAPYITGTTIKHLPQEQLRKLPIPDLSRQDQIDLCRRYEKFYGTLNALESAIEASQRKVAQMTRALLNQAFMGGLVNE